MIPSPLLIGADDVEARMARMGIARITVGMSGVSPSLGAKVFGAPPDQVTHAARLLARLFAIRQMALGVWILTMRKAAKRERRFCAQVNLAVDVADLVTVVPVLARRDLRRTALMSALLASSATLAWLQILEQT